MINYLAMACRYTLIVPTVEPSFIVKAFIPPPTGLNPKSCEGLPGAPSTPLHRPSLDKCTQRVTDDNVGVAFFTVTLLYQLRQKKYPRIAFYLFGPGITCLAWL